MTRYHIMVSWTTGDSGTLDRIRDRIQAVVNEEAKGTDLAEVEIGSHEELADFTDEACEDDEVPMTLSYDKVFKLKTDYL